MTQATTRRRNLHLARESRTRTVLALVSVVDMTASPFALASDGILAISAKVFAL